MTGAPVYTRHSASRALLAVAVLVAAVAYSQSPPAQNTPAEPPQTAPGAPPAVPSAAVPPPSFDDVTIHPNNSDRTHRSHIYYSLENSQFRAVNATVMDLIEWAWDLPASRILGAPPWTGNARYDIDAESDNDADERFRNMIPEAAKSLKREMVQALLADRFALAARLETREFPTYELVVQKKGLKFSPVPDGVKKIETSTKSGTVTVTITNSPNAMSDLVEILSSYVRRVVFDKTGIQGTYSITLKFAADESRSSSFNSTPPETGPPVSMALREQLGLELKPGKGPVEVLAIDHVDMPSKN